jgi:putative ATPase
VAVPPGSPAVVPLDISSPSPPPSSSPTRSPRLSSQADVKHEPSVTTPMSLQPFFPRYPHVTEKVISSMASLSAGDARTALSLLEQVLLAPPETPESALLDSMKRSVATSYDRTGDARYDLISALQKCIRGSQGGAALYWLARMLGADEDPMYIARRLVVCASEDIGMADPHALPLVSPTAPHPPKDDCDCAEHVQIGNGRAAGLSGNRNARMPH